jgi:hypothetical protein
MRRRTWFALFAALLLSSVPSAHAAAQDGSIFTARILGNSLDPASGGPQVIAGFASSLSAWSIQAHRSPCSRSAAAAQSSSRP